MTNGGSREKPLFLDMGPDEALERFISTDPSELKRRLEAKKAPPKRGKGVARGVEPKPNSDDQR